MVSDATKSEDFFSEIKIFRKTFLLFLSQNKSEDRFFLKGRKLQATPPGGKGVVTLSTGTTAQYGHGFNHYIKQTLRSIIN